MSGVRSRQAHTHISTCKVKIRLLDCKFTVVLLALKITASIKLQITETGFSFLFVNQNRSQNG